MLVSVLEQPFVKPTHQNVSHISGVTSSTNQKSAIFELYTTMFSNMTLDLLMIESLCFETSSWIYKKNAH